MLDIALAVARCEDCLADVAMLRTEPGAVGPVASDQTISRLVDALAADDEHALNAICAARAQVRERVWAWTGDAAPDATVIVDVDVGLIIAHSEMARRILRRVVMKDRGQTAALHISCVIPVVVCIP